MKAEDPTRLCAQARAARNHHYRVQDRRITAFAAGCAVLLLAAGAFAQNYSIDWYKIAGGGGVSTGGAFSVTSTAGQHDAGGPLTGSGYSLTGGFWALYALQTPGAPLLTIFLTPTNTAVVSWPYPSTGWNLQQIGNLSQTNWSAPPQTVRNDGNNNFIIVNSPNGNRFYRLSNP